MLEYKYVKDFVPVEDVVIRVYRSGSPQHIMAISREFLQDIFEASTRNDFWKEFGKGLLTPFRLLSSTQYFFDNYNTRDIITTIRIGELYPEREDAADTALLRASGFSYGGLFLL